MYKESGEKAGPQDKYLIGMASIYNTTYYYNPFYSNLPNGVKEEIQQISTKYAKKLHCVFSMKFKDSGEVYFETATKDSDTVFSQEAADKAIDILRQTKQDFFVSLKLWYTIFINKL